MIEQYSGLIYNVYASPTGSQNPPGTFVQPFTLPSNFERANTLPYLTGFQFAATMNNGIQQWISGETYTLSESVLYEGLAYELIYIDENYIDDPSAYVPTNTTYWQLQTTIWEIQHYDYAQMAWETLASGSISVYPNVESIAWINAFSDTLITIDSTWLDDNFQIIINPSISILSVPYTDLTVSANGALSVPSNAATFNGTAIINLNDNYVEILYGILGLVADSGTDIFGNKYRSNVFPLLIDNTDTSVTPGTQNVYWMSRPNPTSSAIEAVYADIIDDDDPGTIDYILINPITQGITCNVYSSSDGDPVTDASDWDSKLWTPVINGITLTKRDSYALPYPVTDRYIKLEFTDLQGFSYTPKGDPTVTYNRFPAWLTTFYDMKVVAPKLSEDWFISSNNSQTVVFDLIDFAYAYYTGDAISSASLPAPAVNEIVDEIITYDNTARAFDPTTLSQINSNLRPYQSQPVLSAPSDYLPAQSSSVFNTYQSLVNYSTEQSDPDLSPTPTSSSGNFISTRRKDGLLNEKLSPQMCFWLTCRHIYKQVQANFTNNRAYFAGIQELAFLRQDYSAPVDQDVYWENFGDEFNGVTIE